MKNFLFGLGILSCIILAGCSAGYVTARPADVSYARPVSPGAGYLWIGGEWEWSGGNYRWNEGSWQQSREGRSYKSGYWQNDKRGYKWQKGGWQK